MPHYFFHLRDGRNDLLDLEGSDCRNRSAAVDRALHHAREILSHDIIADFMDLDQRIDVVNAKGKVVYTQRFADAVAFRAQPPGSSWNDTTHAA